MPVGGSKAWLEGLLSGQVPGTLQHIVQGLVLILATAKHQPMPSDGSGVPRGNTFQKRELPPPQMRFT